MAQSPWPEGASRKSSRSCNAALSSRSIPGIRPPLAELTGGRTRGAPRTPEVSLTTRRSPSSMRAVSEHPWAAALRLARAMSSSGSRIVVLAICNSPSLRAPVSNSFFMPLCSDFYETFTCLEKAPKRIFGQPGATSTLPEQRSRFLRRSISFLLAVLAFGWLGNASGAPSEYPNSLNMTCAQAKNYIAKNDGGILETGNAFASFHSSYCSGQPAYVRTKDETFCFVGQYCDCETTYCSQSYFQGQDN